MKVLLVDDEVKFAEMLAKRLNLRGISADCVHSGEAAIHKTGESSYDVAVLDVKMPDIGGLELERRLKALAPGMKFIFLTGHGSKIDFEEGSAHAACYLAKPIRIEDLIAVLEEVSG
jgi:DNA-binding response OmpR family regulator